MSSVHPLRVVIPGGSGQIGNILARHFHARGDSVVVLSRTTFPAPWRMVAWDGVNLRSWVRELEKADVLINLSGRSVNCRYNSANRREIMESRTQSTRVLGEALNAGIGSNIPSDRDRANPEKPTSCSRASPWSWFSVPISGLAFRRAGSRKTVAETREKWRGRKRPSCKNCWDNRKSLDYSCR